MHIPQTPGLAACARLLVAVLAVIWWAFPAQGQDRRAVSLELVLLVDVSASVDDTEYHLQTNGLAAAFESAGVLSAIRALAPAGMAVCVVQWADHAHQQRTVDWTLLEREADAVILAKRIAAMPRRIKGGHTALGDALAFALNEIRSNGYTGLRRVIDLSGDGRANDGRSLIGAREEVLKNGITINGLAILNELPLLEGYFREHLVGGEGAFVIAAADYSDFARAIRHKLEQEIRSAPLAGMFTPNSTVGVRAGTTPRRSRSTAWWRSPLPTSLPRARPQE